MARVGVGTLLLCLTMVGCDDDGDPAPDPVDVALVDGSEDARPEAATADAAQVRDGARPADVGVPREASVDAAPPLELRPVVRTPCFEDEMPLDTGLDPLPSDCLDLYQQRPELESGCYLTDDGLGEPAERHCWRKRALVLLVNNEIDRPPHADDTDGDGVLDRGDLAGTNFPPDPFGVAPEAVASRMRREIREYFTELSYGSLWVDVADIEWVEGEGGQPDRWFRLQALRPTFANDALMREICLRRGGMTAEDWRRYDWIVTVISHGTAISGSQGREEALPVGPDCEGSETIWRNYQVVKNFRTWSRLGTYFHELVHGLSREPLREPSVGHSEAVHAVTGENAEYGDLTDLMGDSSTRGHMSLPQKLFTRFLPVTVIDVVDAEATPFVGRVGALESRTLERKGLRIPVREGMAYYVEARRNLGNDRRLPLVFKRGVLVKRSGRIASANKSYIVDPTPETPSTRSTDSVLFAGRTFADGENGLYISVLSSDDAGAEVVVRRGEPSAAPPVVDGVEATPGEGHVRLVVTAHPGDPEIDPADLLYFWKLGSREVPYFAADHATGPELEVPDARRDGPLWLVVSDQRGGETWTQVLPAE